MSASARRLPPPVSWQHAVREQVRLIMTGKKRALWVPGLLLALVALPVRIPAIWVGPADADGVKTFEVHWWRFDEIPVFAHPELSSLFVIYQGLLFVGLLWPLSVWRGEPPSERDALRSLPVTGPGHELARVAAGALWLAAACVTIPALVVLGLLATGRGGSLDTLGIWSWIHFVTGPLTLYLLASVAALLAQRPLRAILLTIAALFVPFSLFARFEVSWGYQLLDAVIAGDMSYSAAIGGPVVDILIGDGARAEPLQAWATVLWLGLGLGALTAAARWPRET